MDRIKTIQQLLNTLNPHYLDVIDDSAKHVGHAGARDGKGHFTVRIQADCLNGLTRIQQHRMIYQTLGSLMHTEIHALQIDILERGC